MPETCVVNARYDYYDIYIGRGNRFLNLPESEWANPYRIGPDGGREEVLAKYEAHVRSRPDLMARLEELRGKRLGCWCAPKPCHGLVLIKLLEEEEQAKKLAALGGEGKP